jgi:hypothetical protein
MMRTLNQVKADAKPLHIVPNDAVEWHTNDSREDLRGIVEAVYVPLRNREQIAVVRRNQTGGRFHVAARRLRLSVCDDCGLPRCICHLR